MRLDIFKILFFSTLICFGLNAIVYPGLMSYDSLHALRGARYGVTDSVWPPMVSYIWFVFDKIFPSPSSMHIGQLLLLNASLAYTGYLYTRNVILSFSLVLFTLFFPTILGTEIVIWKDVLMAGVFWLCIFIIGHTTSLGLSALKVRNALALIVFLIIGVCIRHNAIFAAIPLVVYTVYLYYKELAVSLLHKTLKIFFISILVLGFLYFSKRFLDSFSLSSLQFFQAQQLDFLLTVRLLDIVGASICTNFNYYMFINPLVSWPDLLSYYDPRHINLSANLVNGVELNDNITRLWFDIFKSDTYCFFQNKLNLLKYLVGFNDGSVFLLTHPYVDQNEFGYSLSLNKYQEYLFTGLNLFSSAVIFKPYFIYLFSLISIISLAFLKAFHKFEFMILASGVLYFISLVIFGNAADARLPFYTTLVSVFFIWRFILVGFGICLNYFRS